MAGRDAAPGAVPLQQRLIGDETRQIGLLRGARAAGYSSETLDLIVIPSVGVTRQIGRLLRPELRRTGHRKGPHVRNLWGLRGEEARRCRDPNTGTTAWYVRHYGVATIVGPE